MQFNLFDFCSFLDDLRDYIGDSPIIEIGNNIIEIFQVPSGIEKEDLLKIIKSGIIPREYNIFIDQDSTGFYIIRIKEKEYI